MKKINFKRFFYIVRQDYLTFNNLVILVAFLIATSWVWGSLQVMQRNYGLQRMLDQKNQELQLAQLQHDSLELQQRFYTTDEYKELAVRQSLGLVMPGEKILVLPDNSQAAIDSSKTSNTVASVVRPQTSNLEQWANFLFGGYSRNVNNNDNSDQTK